MGAAADVYAPVPAGRQRSVQFEFGLWDSPAAGYNANQLFRTASPAELAEQPAYETRVSYGRGRARASTRRGRILQPSGVSGIPGICGHGESGLVGRDRRLAAPAGQVLRDQRRGLSRALHRGDWEAGLIRIGRRERIPYRARACCKGSTRSGDGRSSRRGSASRSRRTSASARTMALPATSTRSCCRRLRPRRSCGRGTEMAGRESDLPAEDLHHFFAGISQDLELADCGTGARLTCLRFRRDICFRRWPCDALSADDRGSQDWRWRRRARRGWAWR